MYSGLMTNNTDPAGLSSSLPTREQIAPLAGFLADLETGETSYYGADDWREVQRDLGALIALLSQSTPSAEPPRIEDMAPGTTFLAMPRGWTNPTLWEVLRDANGVVVARSPYSWRWCTQRDIDPSTIRDVTPPTNG